MVSVIGQETQISERSCILTYNTKLVLRDVSFVNEGFDGAIINFLHISHKKISIVGYKTYFNSRHTIGLINVLSGVMFMGCLTTGRVRK